VHLAVRARKKRTEKEGGDRGGPGTLIENGKGHIENGKKRVKSGFRKIIVVNSGLSIC